MKQLYFLGIIGLVTFLYSGINYYIGIRGWQAFGSLMSPYKRVYWIIYWLIVFAFILARLGERFFSGFGSKYLALIGSYWLAAMYYLLLIVVFIDVIRLFNKWFKILPGELTGNASIYLYTGLAVVLLITVVLVFGTWNARNPHITRYDITIPKAASNIKNLHAVMISDIHLGNIIDNRRLENMVESINEINPDIVLFAGDIVDENINAFLEQKMAETLKGLKPRLGSFAAMGNHEYIGGHAEDIIHHLEDSGIRILRDTYEKVADSFYIVGRDELMANNFGGSDRKSLEILLKEIDMSLPIILLDHQPRTLEESQKAGVDLQFSGHTHRGQFFPNNYITSRIFEVDWGYLEKGPLQVIVSSGYGTWGPPIRIGSKSELVEVFIRFGEN